jgi:PAS domain S-box-containing protein
VKTQTLIDPSAATTPNPWLFADTAELLKRLPDRLFWGWAISTIAAVVWLVFNPRSPQTIAVGSLVILSMIAMGYHVFQTRARIVQVMARIDRLAEIVRRTGNSVVVTDTQGVTEWTNAAFSKLTGYSTAEIVGKKPGELLQGPLTDKSTAASISHAVRQRQSIKAELVNYHKNGNTYISQIEIEPTYDAQHRHTGFMAIQSDITEQRKMEHELREERALLASILTHLPYYVFWKDCNSIYLGCNPAFAAAAGAATPEQVVGKSDFDLSWTHDEATKYRADDAEVIRDRKPRLHLEETQHMADGKVCWLITSKVPLRNSVGDIIGVLGIFQDVTEQRRLEQQLAQAHRLESIGQLAAGIAHEINTPTQFVSDNLAFLKEHFGAVLAIVDEYRQAMDSVDGPVAWSQRLQTIQATLDRMDYEFLRQEIPEAIAQSLEGLNRVAMIVRAMKEFSHPGSDRLEPADLNRAINSTVEVSRNRWKYTSGLELELACDLPMIPCLLGEFNQVLLNLIVNAADAVADRFGTAGDVHGMITISTHKTDEHHVEVRVKDNGTGIPEAIRDRIFTPFHTTKEVGKGTGQGLALARNVIVNKHHGELFFQTAAGEGTTFIIRLPTEVQTSTIPVSEAA